VLVRLLGGLPARAHHSVVLLRCDLPVVDAGLDGHGYGRSRRGLLRNDFVNMTAAIADHKQDVYDSLSEACDHHATSAVGIYCVGSRFLPWRRELDRNTAAGVITLCEMTVAVKNLDPVKNLNHSVVGTAKRVFAF